MSPSTGRTVPCSRCRGLGRVVASMGLARIGQSMVGVALVLFALAVYDSPALAGIVTFAVDRAGAAHRADRRGAARPPRPGPADDPRLRRGPGQPGPHRRPVAGRPAPGPAPRAHRRRHVADEHPVRSSGCGRSSRSWPRRELWERVNAVDSNGYVVATILGPPLAAALVAFLGAPGGDDRDRHPVRPGRAAILIGLQEPRDRVRLDRPTCSPTPGQGVRYAWANQTIRGLGFSLSVLNLALGGADDRHPAGRPRRSARRRDGRVRVRRVGRVGDDLGVPVRPDGHPRPRVADAGHPDRPDGADGRRSSCRRPASSGRSRRRPGSPSWS